MCFNPTFFFRPVTVWIYSKGLLQARVHESVRECYLGKSEYTRFFSPFCSVFAYYYNFSALPFFKGFFYNHFRDGSCVHCVVPRESVHVFLCTGRERFFQRKDCEYICPEVYIWLRFPCNILERGKHIIKVLNLFAYDVLVSLPPACESDWQYPCWVGQSMDCVSLECCSFLTLIHSLLLLVPTSKSI